MQAANKLSFSSLNNAGVGNKTQQSPNLWRHCLGSPETRGIPWAGSLFLGVFGGKCTSLKMLLTVAEFIAPDEQHVLLLLLLLNPPFEVWLQVQDLLELSRA